MKRLVESNPLNRRHRLADGLVLRWLALPHLAGGKQLYDIAGFNHGTLVGPKWTSGRESSVSGSLIFNGSGDYVQLPDVSGLFTNQATFAAWVKKRVQTPSDPASGSWYFGGTNKGTQNSHYPYSDGAVYDSSFSTTRKSFGNTLVLTQWHHIAITANGSSNSWKFYQNGKQVYSTTLGTFLMPTGCRIGSSIPGGGYNFDGWIDDVALWSRELPVADVWELYQDSREGYRKTLNWRRPQAGISAAAPSSNRRRRVICGS